MRLSFFLIAFSFVISLIFFPFHIKIELPVANG
jgi:hypothetical protein